MAVYSKNYKIDGWPICKDGVPMTKEEIIDQLNAYAEGVKNINDHRLVDRIVIRKSDERLAKENQMLDAGWATNGTYWWFEDSEPMDFYEATVVHRSCV